MNRSYHNEGSFDRANSLSLTDLEEVGAKTDGKKSATPRSKKANRQKYLGRYSAGYSRGGEKLGKLQRRKSRQDLEHSFKDSINDFYQHRDFDEGFASHSSSTNSSAYRCLKGYEKVPAERDKDKDRGADTANSSVSSTEQAQSPMISRQRPTMSTSISTEPYHLTQVTADERMNLFHDVSAFMKTSADRYALCAQLIVNQKDSKCGKLPPTRTVDTRHGHHKYDFSGVLWIILRSYFSGRNVTKGQDATLAEDNRLFEKRAQRAAVLDELADFSLPALELDIRQLGNMHFEPAYTQHLIQAYSKINSLLESFEGYLSQFQNWKDLRETVTRERSKAFAQKIEERVTVLTAWKNTVDDLDEKIKLLGELFEVSAMDHADWVWARPLSPNNKILSVRDSKPVFEAYVKKSMNSKGMKKVLMRVSKITELSVLKAAILLQKGPSTYAQAATKNTYQLELNDIMKARYSEMSAHGFNQQVATAMHLPRIEPLFFFLIQVPVELTLKWVEIRSQTEPDNGCELDSLTLSTFIEETRDCLEEAVYVKKRFVRMLRTMCPNQLPCRLYPSEYIALIGKVFNKYMNYLRLWCNCPDVIKRAEPCRMFTKLEHEWSSAVNCGRSILAAFESLSSNVSDLVPDLLRVWVTDHWESKLHAISTQFNLQLGGNERRFGRISESSGGQSFSTMLSELNRVIRDVKEREARIFAQMRLTVTELLDAQGYAMIETWEVVKAELRKHHWMIEIDESSLSEDDKCNHELSKVSIFIDEKTVNDGCVDQCFYSLFEKRKVLENDGHMIIIPNEYITSPWGNRTVKRTLDKVKRMACAYLRRDLICVVGNYSLSENYPSIFSRVAPSCSSSESIDENFNELTSALLCHLDKFWELFLKTWQLLEWLDISHTKRENICSSLEQIFTVAFQLHRDTARYVCESYKSLYGKEIVEKCARVVFKWKELVELKQVQPRGHVPIWAQNAFNFMQYLADPKWTNVMDDQLFKDFSLCVKECSSMVVSKENVTYTMLSPQSISKRISQAESSRSTTSGEENAQSRRVRLSSAAAQVDKYVEQKIRDCFPLGQVVEAKREKFTLEQYTNVSKPAPFQWNLLEFLSAGTFGVVYKGYNVQEQKVIAVKKMKVHRDAVKMIEGEVDIFRELDHPNLVKYYGVEVHQDEVSILMEYCSEGTLERICGEGMDLSLVRRYTNHLLKAVEYLHSKHVIHRDIKPQNIFLDLQNVLKLGDFGCSIRLKDSSTVFGEIREFVGTPQYMAPEVFDFGDVREDGTFRGYGRMVDIWSIGCVVIEMLTGRPPWPKLTKLQIAWQMCNENKRPAYPPIANQRKDLKRFLDMCFVKDPSKRAGPSTLLHTPFANVHIDTESTFESMGFEKIYLSDFRSSGEKSTD